MYWVLKNNNEKILNDGLDYFIECYLNPKSKYSKFHFDSKYWSCVSFYGTISKQEVTIQQLKEILQPMENKETLEQQLEKIKAEVNRLKEAIEESNKIKIGDWVANKLHSICFKVTKEMKTSFLNEEEDIVKITDQDLINKLNELIK